ncbi:MAG TPA: PAS domain S-box protein [Terriglobales bacterium]|nr:PAS domain S-box protein [Terriglobales bacterium]
MSGTTDPRSTFDKGQDEINLHHQTHSVQFYSDDKFLLDALSRFIGSALGAGDAGIVIATPEHRTELAGRLSGRGLDVVLAVEQGRYIALDAAETLSQFLVDGWPDEKSFVELIGGVISQAKAAAEREHGRAAMFGEMVALLWAEGKTEAALRLEQLWNQIAHSHSFSLVCAYPLSKFYREDHGEAFMKICDEHSAVFPVESYALASEEERLRIVAQLQQRALALEDEIARRREAQQAASKLAAIVESSEDAIVSKDLNGIVSSWNASAERIFGYKAEEIIGKPITLIIPPELHSEEEMILSRIRAGERIEHFETVRVTKSGKRIDVSLTISPVKDADGRVIGGAKVARDVTERKRTEEALRRAEKLAATGQVAGSIAHEINNPMQALTNVLALISFQTSLDQSTRKLVSLAQSELGRMSHIARQMLSFYRESPVPVPLKVKDLMEEVLELFAMRMRANEIRLQRRYDFNGEICAFPVEIRQLFANLVENAVEASGRRGQIRVHIYEGRDWGAPGRRGVRIVIADNGSGIAPDIRHRIFEPFFTTKPDKGTGLGLWSFGVSLLSTKAQSSLEAAQVITTTALPVPSFSLWEQLSMPFRRRLTSTLSRLHKRFAWRFRAGRRLGLRASRRPGPPTPAAPRCRLRRKHRVRWRKSPSVPGSDPAGISARRWWSAQINFHPRKQGSADRIEPS